MKVELLFYTGGEGSPPREMTSELLYQVRRDGALRMGIWENHALEIGNHEMQRL